MQRNTCTVFTAAEGHQGRFEPISGILGKLDGATVFGNVMTVQMTPAEPGEE